MNTKLTRLSIAIAPLLGVALLSPNVFADEPRQIGDRFEDAGPRYEDDAWYDVSEWFDGNDYNPTDEAIGRWDDEKFDYNDEQTSSDDDNDPEWLSAEEFYGTDYDDGYGVYNDKDKDGNYESYSRYHDTDGDYLNDAYATYKDADGDGMYETYDFSEIAGKHAVHSSNVAQTTQKGLSGKSVKVAGKITERTSVKRLGGLAMLLQVQTSDGKSVWVDVGYNTGFPLFKGGSLTAFGPMAKAGNKQVLVATTVEIQGKQLPVERTGRKYSGTVQSTKTANVRGEKRTVAKVKTDDGKTMTVDMGAGVPATKYKQGDKVSVTGVPVKIGDRVMLIADTTSL